MRNGGYSVTVRHEHYKQGAAGGVLRHAIRSVEEEHGIFREHSNKKIDGERTSENIVFVNDGNGGFKEADSPDEAMQHRKSRLAKRADKRKLRSNQNTHMETLLQLDNEFTGSSEEFLSDAKGTADETRRLLQVLTDYVVDKVGQENVNYIALHLDETSPHVQIGWTPLAEDGSLDFRKILGETKLWKKDGRMRGTLTKKMMSDQHKEVRALLNEHGYPAVEVFSTPQHEDHAPYKRQQAQLDAKLTERQYEIEQRESDCELRERRVSRREDALTKDKKKLSTERETFEAQREEQQRNLEAQQQQLNEVARRQQEDIAKREKALKEKTEAEQQKLSNEREAMLTEVQEREDSVGEREQEQQDFKTALLKYMNSKPFRDAAQEIGSRGTEKTWRIAEETIGLAERIGVEWKPGSFSGTSNSHPQARERTRERVKDPRPPARTLERSTEVKKKKSGNVAEILRKMDEQKQNQGGDGSPDY